MGFADTSKICNRLIIPDSILVNGENMPVSLIQGGAFSYRKDLQYVKLPNTLKYIIYNAFSNCENLDSVFIPASVEVIKPTAFDESNLVSITVSPQNPYYDSRDNSHAIIDSKTNEMLAGSASSTIPASVTKLREKAFSNRKRLKQITIPKNIRSISYKCFCSCDSLFRVDFEDNSSSESNENGLTIERDAFENCKNLTSIKLPNRLDTIGVYAFYGCERHPDCDFVSWQKPAGENCPKCGKYMVQKLGKNGSYKQCSDTQGCGFVMRPAGKQKNNDEE